MDSTVLFKTAFAETVNKYCQPRPHYDGITASEIADIMLKELKERNLTIHKMADRLEQVKTDSGCCGGTLDA